MKIRFLLFIIISLPFSLIHAQQIKFQMHSHNDYEQEFPLSTALSHNFKSIEVDIFEFENDIVVSHDDENLDIQPTLTELYLDPLSKYNFENNQSIFLMIDLKMEGHKILKVLHRLVKPYAPILKNRNHPSEKAPVQIILSGSVDKDFVIANDSFPFFFIDGRITDLDKNYDSYLMPLISSNIEDLYCWKPSKKIKKGQLKSILKSIDKTHSQGKMIRFWNTQNTTEMWDLLVALNVDLIGVDDIDKIIEYASKFKN